MAHMMEHFLTEGIGLRHFIDYYYVLKAYYNDSLDANRMNITNQFVDFGLLKFARGVMWVEKNCLGLEEKYLLVEPNEKTGKLILEEMLEGGNFGQYDERYKARKMGLLLRGVTDSYRLLKLAKTFPIETNVEISK